MIKLNIPNISNICEWWKNSVCSLNRRCDNQFFSYWNANKESIVSSKPDELGNWISDFNSHDFGFASVIDKQNAWSEFCRYMKGQYKRVRELFGTDLLEKLNVKVCPYCNRQFINMVDDHKNIKPELDHFYPKSKYPYLALSFYNLIPSCSVCNHAKGEEEIAINPYKDDFHSHKVDFSIDSLMECLFGEQGNWKIALPTELDGECESNIEVFALNELYSQHKDIAKEIAIRSIAYDSEYLKELEEVLKNGGFTESKVKRIILGNFTDKDDLGYRPFSKLTSDIYNQIKTLS